MLRIVDKSIDCIITDLPYYKVLDNSWDNQWELERYYFYWCYDIFKESDSGYDIF